MFDSREARKDIANAKGELRAAMTRLANAQHWLESVEQQPRAFEAQRNEIAKLRSEALSIIEQIDAVIAHRMKAAV